jgi:hypothetical protein
MTGTRIVSVHPPGAVPTTVYITVESCRPVLLINVEMLPVPLVPLDPVHEYTVEDSEELKLILTGLPQTSRESGLAVI